MRNHPLAGLVVLLAIFGFDLRADAAPPEVNSTPVTVERVAYNGWPDAWRVRNQSCELVVVPAVSRVMRFAPAGGQNLLWEDPALSGKTFPTDDGTWHNLGGEKLWPTQQKDLFKKYTGHDGWPPPWPWDAGASRAEPIANGVRLVLPHDRHFGAHAVREFTLDPTRPLAHVRQWIEKTEGPPAEMTVWTVCQANDPILSLLPSADGKFSDFGTPSGLIQSKPGYLTLGRDAKQGLKIGVPVAGQNGWVASVFNGPSGRKLMLVQSHRLISAAKYPDAGLQAELYTSPISFALYTEMELLSPLVALRPGEKLEDDRVWQVVPVTGEDYAHTATRAHAQALERLK
jgi:hypothetical protein